MIQKLKKHYYLSFTITFIVVAIIAFCPFWINGKSFIWTESTKDGLQQHYNALMYFGKWGREIIKNIFQNHTFEVPLWDFSIGYGSDIISSLHYYVIGDPLNLLSIVVPSEYTEYLYDFLVVFRVYLAGVTFSMYCFYMKQQKKPVFIGAFIYMFCGYALFAFARHPFFINPMIYLPLLLISAEKVMTKKRITMLMGIVFLMTISNFYFSYMLLIFLVIYVAIRFFTRKHEHLFKEGFGYLWRFALGIFTGIFMSGIVFIPTVNLLLSGERFSNGTSFSLFYTLGQYENLIAGYITSGDSGKWACLGFVPIAVIAVIVLFLKKQKYKELKIGFIVLTTFLIFPFFGHVLNGMSYVTNRWVFAYAFMMAYIFVRLWDELIKLSILEKKKLLFTSIIYFVILLVINKGTNENTMASMVIFFLFIFILIWPGYQKNGKALVKDTVFFLEIFCLTICSIFVNVKYEYGVDEGNYISEFLDMGTARNTIYQTGDYAVRQVDPDLSTVERMDQPDGLYNSSWQNRNYSLSYFCSMENSTISNFMKDMGIPLFYPQKYYNLNSRTMLNELVSVKYYVDQSVDGKLPYGYEKVDTISVSRKNGSEKYTVAENELALPLGYTYDSYISESEYAHLDPIQKQQALMQGVLLEQPLENYEKADLEFSDETRDYDIVCSNGVYADGTTFIATEEGGQITLKFDGLENCETYVYLKNIRVEGKSEKMLYYDNDSEHFTEESWEKLSAVEKTQLNTDDKYYTAPTKYDIKFSTQYSDNTLRYLSEESEYYQGQEEFVVNLGYHEQALNEVTITFPSRGEYDLGEVKVVCQPMTQYEEQAQKLAEDTMENETLGVNTVSGTISLEERKILVLSIPYSAGWKAYVDGEEVEILQGNTMCMAIPLEKGEHSITLRYMTPGIKLGAVLSGCGFSVFLVAFLYAYIKNKRKLEL